MNRLSHRVKERTLFPVVLMPELSGVQECERERERVKEIDGEREGSSA